MFILVHFSCSPFTHVKRSLQKGRTRLVRFINRFHVSCLLQPANPGSSKPKPRTACANPARPTPSSPPKGLPPAHAKMATSAQPSTPSPRPAPVSIKGRSGSLVDGTVQEVGPECLSDFCLLGSPSAPRELTAAGSGSKVMLHWLPPSNTGGRDDILYVVTCEQCLPDQVECQPCDASIHFSENPRHLKATALTISGLEPHLNYTFTVEARNGVSRTKAAGTHTTLRVSLNQTGKRKWPRVQSWQHSVIPA